MKKLVFLAAAVAVYFAFQSLGKQGAAVKPSRKTPVPPADDLAHKLQDAWSDHHTIA